MSCPPAGGTLGFSSSRQPHPAGRGQLGMGCLWGRMALHPPVGLHRDTHWWPGPGCIWHVAPSHLPCGISPAPELRADTRTHPGLIKGLLLIYSKSLQENRARNSTTALAANESLQIIYWTLVSQSDHNCCFSSATAAKSHKTPFISRFNQWLPMATSAGRGGSEGLTGKAPGDAQG